MIDVASLRDYLLAGRNADGGWGYVRGKGSRLEPTCCALLALGSAGPSTALTSWPAHDGLLLERAGGDANYGFHALALLALMATGAEHAAGNARLIEGLQRAYGRPTPPSTVNRQPAGDQGWSWIADTYSWAEPTAWGVLALKRARALGWPDVDQARITASETLLFDRACVVGGWNYGTSNVMGRELPGYVPTTAIVLLALQDKIRDVRVQRSLEFLESEASWESSSYALGLAAIALRAYRRNVSGVLDALRRQLSITCDLGQQLGVSLALLALQEANALSAFALQR